MTYRWRLVTVMTNIVSRKINLLPQFWEFSNYSFTNQQLSSMRKKFVLFGEPRTKNHKKSRKIYLLPQFWEFSHNSFTKQQFSSVRKKFGLFGGDYIENSRFKIRVQDSRFRIQNSKFKIQKIKNPQISSLGGIDIQRANWAVQRGPPRERVPSPHFGAAVVGVFPINGRYTATPPGQSLGF